MMQIIQHIPFWVWIIFFLLLGLGWLQSNTRTMLIRRPIIISLAMVMLSGYGVLSAFRGQGLALLIWLAGLACTVAFFPQTHYTRGLVFDATRRYVTVPGSWLPLALMMGIFFTKMFVNINLALKPALAQHITFVLCISAVYGLLSGLFASRSFALWRQSKLTWQEQAHAI